MDKILVKWARWAYRKNQEQIKKVTKRCEEIRTLVFNMYNIDIAND